MRTFRISRFVSVILFLALCGSQAKAQLNHFIYLQSDNQQPFYVKYNNRIISSSAAGYLILSKLKEGVVEFAVVFPKSNQLEQQFQCILERADKGFLVKNFAEKGWGLYDLQSSAIIYASVKTEPKTSTSNVSTAVADDPFSNMLSKVTQDSTVKTVVVLKKQPVQPVPVDTPITAAVTTTSTVKDTVVTVAVTTPVPKDTIATTIVTEPEKVSKPEVTTETEPAWTAPAKASVKQIRKFESREGNDYVFEIQETNGAKDTVRLFIEKDTSMLEAVVIAPVVQQEVKKDSIVPVQEVPKEKPVVEQPKKDSLPVVAVPVKEEVIEKKPVVVQPPVVSETVEKKQPTALPNSNCKDFATEDDLVKLRRRMATQRKDEQMVSEAQKAFRNKCYTTAQLRNLSVLFLSDEGRYRFFDAAMPFVTDFSNFKSLGETIIDEYYKRRFMALIPAK